MQDRPSATELIAAIAAFLRADVLPGTEGRTRYHLLVALNLAETLRRELAQEPAARQREWAGLHRLGAADAPAAAGTAAGAADPAAGTAAAATPEALHAANTRLCTAIRAGDYDADPGRAALLAHLRTVVADKLRIANPALLERLEAERAEGARH